jgi:hypothetical protein
MPCYFRYTPLFKTRDFCTDVSIISIQTGIPWVPRDSSNTQVRMQQGARVHFQLRLVSKWLGDFGVVEEWLSHPYSLPKSWFKHQNSGFLPSKIWIWPSNTGILRIHCGYGSEMRYTIYTISINIYTVCKKKRWQCESIGKIMIHEWMVGDPIFRQTQKYLKQLHSHDNPKNPERAECKCTWARSKSKWNGSEVYFVPGAGIPLWGHHQKPQWRSHPTISQAFRAKDSRIMDHCIPRDAINILGGAIAESIPRLKHTAVGDELYGLKVSRFFIIFIHFPHWNSHMIVFVPQ